MEKKYLIYSYEFYDYVYVGLTNNIEQRDYQHRKMDDSLNRFAKENGYQIPKPKILETELSSTEAKLKEENWLSLYLSKGFKKINIAKCGLKYSALGPSKGQENSFIKGTKKSKITEIQDKIKNGTITKDDAVSMFYRYSTKTQMSKMFPKLYEICNECGWLDLFPRKNKPKHSKTLAAFEPGVLHKEDLPSDAKFFNDGGSEYCIDMRNGELYKVNKKNVRKLKKVESDGMVMYTYLRKGETNLYPYHRILAKAKGIDYDYVVNYKDGDPENINESNILFIKTDYSKGQQIFDSRAIIFKDGTLIGRTTRTPVDLERRENGFYYNDVNLDKIVFNYFVGEIDFGTAEIRHKDGNPFNNNVDNLVCDNFKQRNRMRFKDGIKAAIEKYNNEYKIFIIDNDEQFFVSKTADEVTANEIYEAAVVKIKKNGYWRQWIRDFKEIEIPEYIKQSVKRRNDAIRCESSGCYWHAPRNCWKSKIYYIDKEYSLGYFETFEEGKMLYEQAASAIKFNVFENWYKTIENRRKDIKKIFSVF